MTILTSQFTTRQVNTLHDRVVRFLCSKLAKLKAEITYPDTEDRTSKQPDICVARKMVIEVKVLNPTKEDYKLDIKRQEEWENRRFTTGVSTVNPKPLQHDLADAVAKFKQRTEKYKVVVFYSPLRWQLPDQQYLLSGLTQLNFMIGDSSPVLTKQRKVNVPLKKSYSNLIDAIVFIQGDDFEKIKLWKVSRKDTKLFNYLSPNKANLFE